MGAAILAARACLRTGTGLLTTHVPASGYPSMQSAVPESIFSIDSNPEIFSDCPEIGKYSAIAAGPGLGKDNLTAAALRKLLENANKPLLLDADAINILSAKPDMIRMLPPESIITPHPGEFDRLAGKSETGFDRNQKQIAFSTDYKIVIVLKGAYTSITLPEGKCYYNSTGNPGMATGGSGDVLTGMILSLLAQGYHTRDAALAGVYIHGLAGDIASAVHSQESMIASDIIENIGKAYQKIWKK
jgi:NAD(P)H-hydrate epimerase